MTDLRVPVATYRLQFTSELGFDEATALIPYLEALGITDLYASPLLLAREGSEHGYDVIDPRKLDPGVGGRSGFEEMWAALRARNMGLLLDIVPNHMAATYENPWWRDILRWGPHSIHAPKFDINWDAEWEPGAATGKLILPILAASPAETLARGELKLAMGSDGFQIHYHEQHFPVYPGSYRFILEAWEEQHAGKSPDSRALADTLALLSAPNEDKPDTAAMTAAVQAGKKLWELYLAGGQVKDYLDRVLHYWNKGEGKERFAALLETQYYRPVYWRDGRQRVNYRRFFDISDLVTLCIEDEDVFRAVHSRVLELARDGAITGLRIDHVDGLHDPEGYLTCLQNYLSSHRPDYISAAKPARIGAEQEKDFYVVVEKILKKDETLPPTWPVEGTTGYDFMNILNGLFVDGQGLEMLDSIYTQLTGAHMDFSGLVNTRKKRVMRDLFSGEMAELSEQLVHLAAQDSRTQELAPEDLEAALVGVTAAFPVYRTYTRGFSVTPRDRQYIEEALKSAATYGDGSEQARAFLQRLLLLELTEETGETRHAWLRFVMRWQQFTGPIMAKGFEDTSLYLYNRLISLNEVGSDPAKGTVGVQEYHQRMLARHTHMPYTLNATSTHDTKRSEDVRARINVLTEIPELWYERVRRWQAWNAPKKETAGGRFVPEPNEEFLLYQTLLGAWPLEAAEETEFMERLSEYLVKASREAKQHSSWLDPNEEYEQAFCSFARKILEDTGDNQFRRDLQRLVKPVSFYGALNSLAQVVLKAVCPGVPDFYMGCELWDYSLVDPDNRRSVDFAKRTSMLTELQERTAGTALARELLENWEDGRLKIFVTWKALGLRRAKGELFSSGAYLPLETGGAAREHLCALARHTKGSWALAVVPRLIVRLSTGAGREEVLMQQKPPVGRELWADTILHLPAEAPTCWRNIFTEEIISAAEQTLPLAQVLASFPVALLTTDDSQTVG